jgi:hypothetical protein
MLQAGESLTALDALCEIGCFRLAARIGELREDGHDIISEPYKYTNRWGETKTIASYRLYEKHRDFEYESNGQGNLL